MATLRVELEDMAGASWWTGVLATLASQSGNAAHSDRAAALFATLDPDDQQALLGLMRRLLDALAATSTAEGRPLNLDTEAFRSG
jgi:hypothetical protein